MDAHAALAPKISCRLAFVKRLNIALNTSVATINTPIQAALLWAVKLEELEEELSRYRA